MSKFDVGSRFSDRIILLSKGHIHADGTSEEVITEENIESVYGVHADVVPVDGRPYVIFHADESISLGEVDDTPSEDVEVPVCEDTEPAVE